MKLLHKIYVSIIAIHFSFSAYPCTNLIVTSGASSDGSVMITYAADSHTRYGYLFHYPASQNKPGTMLDIFHYETGKWLGQIPEAEKTYSVIGFMNEHQVAIGETTWGGLKELQKQDGAILDYGSLMKIALQRSKTAREAIRIIDELVQKYGYASGGESFSISDANEVWIMEIIGKGNFEKGAVWVAMKVPEGYISGHANQARITRFPFVKKNQWDNPMQSCFHSPDVVAFARKNGFYKGDDANFSFSDVYNPVNFGGARYCDARIWAFFRKFNKDVQQSKLYEDYALGKIQRHTHFPDGKPNPEGFATNRLPLWIKPDRPLSLQDVRDMMRDHYEDSPLDMREGLGAGAFACPYRWRPMEFEVDSVWYLHERAIATQQTGFSFIAQSRKNLPNAVAGILWFGVDDADGCVYVPLFCGITNIPSSFAQGNGSMIEWSDSSAFWIFNLVNNWAYTRYNHIHPEIETEQKRREALFDEELKQVETAFLTNFVNDKNKAIQLLTDYSCKTANQLVSDWKKFFQYLFMKYMDGNRKLSENQKLLDNGNGKGIPKKPEHPGYGIDWNRKMIENTGERYKVIKN